MQNYSRGKKGKKKKKKKKKMKKERNLTEIHLKQKREYFGPHN